MITAGLTESMIAAIPDLNLPSTSNDARPPSGSPRMWSCRTPSLVAAQFASLVRAAASSGPAGMWAKSRTPLEPSVAITRCVSRPSLASFDNRGPMTRSSSGWANTARMGRLFWACAESGTIAVIATATKLWMDLRIPIHCTLDGFGARADLLVQPLLGARAMANSDRIRVIFHGAVVMLVGLLCGLPTVNEEEPARLWHTAHESLILIGILLLAMSSVLQFLVLPKREATALVWALLATGYGLMVGLVIQG